MKLKHHITISSLIAGILYALFKSWGLAIASFISGIFIDLDHIFDYVREHGWHPDKMKFFNFFYGETHEKITLIFHGWEWLLFLCMAAAITDFTPWITGVLVGYGHHLISDYLYSKANIGTYSLIWRWHKNFNSKILFPRDRGYNP